VVVHVVAGLPGLRQGVAATQNRMCASGAAELVGGPALAVVGEMRPDDRLGEHPQVAVVELVHEARRRRAGHDLAATARDEHAGAEGVAPGVLEDDVDVAAAAQLADLLTEAEMLPRVLLPGLRIPEAVVLLGTVDDPLGAGLAALLCLGLARDDAHRVA